MKQQGLNKCWIEGKGAINGWCSIPSTITAVPTPAAISVSDLVNSPQNLFPFWSTVSQMILKFRATSSLVLIFP